MPGLLTYGYWCGVMNSLVRGGRRRISDGLSASPSRSPLTSSRHPQTNVYAHIVNENAIVDSEYLGDCEIQGILLQVSICPPLVGIS